MLVALLQHPEQTQNIGIAFFSLDFHTRTIAHDHYILSRVHPHGSAAAYEHQNGQSDGHGHILERESKHLEQSDRCPCLFYCLAEIRLHTMVYEMI